MISRKMLANSAAQILFCKPADDFRLDFQRELHHVLAQPVVVWSRGHHNRIYAAAISYLINR